MRRFKLLAAAAAFLMMILPLFALTARAEELSYEAENGNRAYILDEADLLTDEEETRLMERLKGVLEYGGAALVTTDYNPGSTESYARSAYRGYFGTSSGTLLLIDMDNRYLQFYSDGSIYRVLTESRTNEITDNIYSYASEKDYFTCADKAFEQVIILLSGGKISTPMRYVTNAIFAVGLALMLNIWLVVRQRKKPDPSRIIDTLGQEHRGAVRNVSTRMTNQRRTRHVESSGRGGGGGGISFGGGGGGGHSGGGGGHSF